MGDFTADTSELEAFARRALAAADQLRDLESPNREAGRVVLTATRPPRASGALAAGTYADHTAGGVTFASTARYWTFVHWGAPRRAIRARPFFVEAIDATTDQIVSVYAAHATDQIKEATR